ncbi:MAG: hypothetical protein CL610_26610 [Anaerolineaceae bacterium]|nr:hypothetical protein [Anaerolineaceae bacterium]
MDDVKRLLKQAPLFRGLKDSQLNQMVALAHAEAHAPGTVIFEQDDAGDCMYVIADGQVEIQVKDHTGGLNAVLIMGEGQIFGEMALLDQGARSATVVTLRDGARLYSISGDDFKALCQQDTAIGYVMMRNIALDLSFKIRHQNSFS